MMKTLIPLSEVKRFIVDVMASVGTARVKADVLADVLISADYRGHYSHGLNRLELYMNDVKSGMCDSQCDPVVVKESAATALVDGQNGLGPVVGSFCMDLALQKARSCGVGWVVAKGSNHFGIAGWYTMRAADQGLVGLSFTNTSPLVAPTRTKESVLGTNPVSVAAPGKEGDSFVLDMATCAVAVGKIEVQRRKAEPIPEGWAIDSAGRSTTDAAAAMSGSLLPLGGLEETSGYKGYGLAMMVELFCGIMGGCGYGPNIRRWMDVDKNANLGQCFIAVDPSCFASGFEDRLQDLMDYLRSREPIGDKPVLVAGDPERIHMKSVDEKGGVTYHINQIKASHALAEKLGVTPMEGKD